MKDWSRLGSIPTTAADALEWWDDGDVVTSISLGGIGPGYEQCIQVTTFELIRYFNGRCPRKPSGRQVDMFQKAIWQIDVRLDLGLSGAQAGAAKLFAYRAMKGGWKKEVERYPLERRILVSNRWIKS